MAYLLDSDVLMEARKRHYGFDICPGFWDWIDIQYQEGAVLSVEKVRDEIGVGTDALITWADNRPAGFFAPPDGATQAAFATVSQWANSQNYTPRALSEFFQKADFFLVAHALAHSLTLVTHERAANTQTKVKIPNVCVALNIGFIDPFEMLRREGARFVLEVGP
jgi:hypothetical protein